MTLSLNPVYNLKAVLKETGIKPDVLRAWERRYGLPMPQRTAGGHRLYSEHDIGIIKWLLVRQEEGLSISHAVEMWKEKLAGGTDPLGGSDDGSRPVGSSAKPPVTLIGIDELRSRWLAACLNFNEISAEEVLNQAFALYPVEFVCTEVLQRGLGEVGLLWYENRASVQQEHFVSALALRRLDALLQAAEPPTRPETIIVGCPANEWHTFTPLLLALFIRRRGYNVIYLGANVPPAHFVETIEAVSASLVVLAAQQLNTAATLQYTADMIAQRGGVVAFGGRIFAVHPDLVNCIAGHYLGSRLDGAIHLVEGLLAARPASPQVRPYSGELAAEISAFVSHRAYIEATLNQEMAAIGAGTN
jgi:MerR family transcriptional regulator, light-induced transcriptional regulator